MGRTICGDCNSFVLNREAMDRHMYIFIIFVVGNLSPRYTVDIVDTDDTAARFVPGF